MNPGILKAAPKGLADHLALAFGKQLLVDGGNGLAILLRGGVTVGIQLVKDVLAVRAPSASPGEPNAKSSFALRAVDGEVKALLVLPPSVGSAT